MSCNLKNVLSTANDCKENPAGISNYVMIVPTGVNGNIKKISIDDASNQYKITANGGTLKGYRIDFRAQTGQVTSEDNGPGKGWSHTGTGRVELSEDAMALVSRTLHNMDKFMCFFPTGKNNEWKVVGNELGEVEWGVTADSGTARSDDHGLTFTATCGYQVYPTMKYIGAIVQAEDGTFTDDSADEVVIIDSSN